MSTIIPGLIVIILLLAGIVAIQRKTSKLHPMYHFAEETFVVLSFNDLGKIFYGIDLWKLVAPYEIEEERYLIPLNTLAKNVEDEVFDSYVKVAILRDIRVLTSAAKAGMKKSYIIVEKI